MSHSSCSPKSGHNTHSIHTNPATHPLRVTRHCRSPSFRKISTTVSMGVWSVTVKGLRFRTRRSFRGWGLLAGSSGGSSVKYMMELLTMPSCLCLAFSRMGKQKDEPHQNPLLSNCPNPKSTGTHILPTTRILESHRKGVQRANSTSLMRGFSQTSVKSAIAGLESLCYDPTIHCQSLKTWA